MGSRLNGIVRFSATDVWAVGQTQQSDGSILSLTENLNGTAWSIMASPDPGELGPLPDTSLDGVASPGGLVVWTVGAQANLDMCCLQTVAMETTAG